MPIDPNIPLSAVSRVQPFDPMQTLAQVSQIRNQQMIRQQAQQQFEQNQQKWQQEQQEYQEKRTARDTLNEVMKVALNEDGTFNMDALKAGVVNAGHGNLWPTLAEGLAGIDTKIADVNAKRATTAKTNQDLEVGYRDLIGAAATQVKTMPENLQLPALQTFIGRYVKDGIIPETVAYQTLEQVMADPSRLPQVLDAAIAVSPQQQKIISERPRPILVPAGSSVRDPLDPTKVLVQGTPDLNLQEKDVTATLPDGTVYTGKANYNPDTGQYLRAGGTTPFPEGTTFKDVPPKRDPILDAIARLNLDQLRRNTANMTPIQAAQANALADDFTRDSKDYVIRAQSYQTIKGAAEAAKKGNSPAANIAIIFAFMRQQDPNSTVREGEYATAQNAAGVSDKIRNLYNRVVNGERLSEAQVDDFLAQSTLQFQQAQQRQRGLLTEYSQRATRRGLNPADVVMDYDKVFGIAEDKKEDKKPGGTGTATTPRTNPF